MRATAIQEEQISETAVNALLIYDDIALAAKARAILERAANVADGWTRWNVKPWRSEMLNLSPAADEALAEAADAHLIVLALRNAGAVPAGLGDWLEQWAQHREVPDAEVGVFNGAGLAGPSAPVARELSQFAERHGLTLAGANRGVGGNESAAMRDSFDHSAGDRHHGCVIAD